VVSRKEPSTPAISPAGSGGGCSACRQAEKERMSRISIVDLEVFYNVGVTDQERATPQRLLVTVDMNLDFSSASISDRIEKTINYQEVADELQKFGQNRNWKLLEKLASNIADFILARFKPQSVMVEIKKFSIPKTRYVAVSVSETRGGR
jgi:7,8-dihydroneopterin aldolase/epimerase/oxygenase